MKLSFSGIAIIAALGSSATAMQMSGCSISHNSGDGGNEFHMYWNGVPSVSMSTICGHFSDDLTSSATYAGMQVKGSVTCSTSGSSDMSTVLTLDKQSCQSQAGVIVGAMQNALGSAGSLSSSTSQCTFDGVC